MASNKVSREITRVEAVILGYGYFRSFTEQPWFTTRELTDAMTASPIAEKVYDHAGLTKRMGGLAARDYLDYDRISTARHRGQTPYYGRLTEAGAEALANGLVYFVREPKPPLTVAAVLAIPESVAIVMAQSSFPAKLLSAVTGELPTHPDSAL